ncbi:translational GTPase TypA [Acidihalobacter prosperus]|uniref:Large ribosomal subunit assembly factor BipA n=1 Tax=Acidihalobacter prosperus TaxID=160660 RepID=A0A1A6C3V4_9GAMM|nr:translational GTPase TypA [Acidihalobacter prosperus]OBS09241.1 elongation factor 4 [Acidihalobacter prosperus]
MTRSIRNIAIIAHVDHGKTTLVDKLLQQSGTFDARAEVVERVMDSNALEKERGITILAKNTAIDWQGYHINIVDTPGHADFGGEVERVMSMVDSVLLLVDAVDGPMPQTRFVTQKALAQGLRPIVVVNKVDRPGARPDWVVDQTFDLFDRLGATDEQLDFRVIYASALNGYAGTDSDVREGNMDPLFQAIVEHVQPPEVDPEGPLQLQVSSLDYNSYVGVIGIGRITRGRIKTNTQVAVIDRDGNRRNGRVLQVLGFHGLERVEVPEAEAGDIIAFTGLDPLNISDTLCSPQQPEALPPLTVDEPTVSMTFQVNTSPFAGRDGKYVTSRQIRERLERELVHNVALRVEETDDPDKFKVSGRGELHLSVLIENMRREGYELGVSRPEVIVREVDGVREEPYEQLTVDVEEDHQGAVMQKLGERGGELKDMIPDGQGRVRLDYIIPARGLIGFRTEFLTATQGTGLLYNVFDHYGALKRGEFGQRNNGVLIANGAGKALGYALFNLQERGRLFIGPGEEVYEGMIVGIHSRDNDLVVNPLKAKQLTNIRAAGSDENILLTPPIRMSLEQALEFIDDDELVEVTPHHIRLRKKFLLEHERKRSARATA